MVVGDIPRVHAYRFPGKEAIIDVAEDRRYTWRELNGRVNRLANSLSSLGLSQGHKAAVLCPSSFRYPEICFANAKNGALTIPLNIRLSSKELVFLLNDSEADAIFVHSSFAQAIKSIRAELSTVKHVIGMNCSEFDHEYEELIRGASVEEPDTDVKPDDTYVLYYTGGTTGVPKGCLLSHRNAIMSGLLHQCDYGLLPSDRYLPLLPMYFTAGIASIITPIISGCCLVVMTFEPDLALEILSKQDIAGTIMVPTMFIRLLEHPDIMNRSFKKMRAFTIAASPLQASVLKKGISLFGKVFFFNYGQSESSASGTTLRPEEMILDGPKSKRLNSVGKPMVGLQTKVVNEKSQEVRWGSDEIGEILMKGETIMKGYWKRPKDNEEALKNGWLHTGDLAKVDEEGFIYIVDRKKDMLISGGINIYPREIERVISNHPAVEYVAVIGVPDDQWGESIKAIIQPKTGFRIDEKEIIDWSINNGLASYKKPKTVEVINEMPLSASGKILKSELKKKYWSGYEKAVH